jgi:hypothetical protein
MGEKLNHILREYRDNPIKTIAATMAIVTFFSGIFFYDNLTQQKEIPPQVTNTIMNDSKYVVTDDNLDDNSQKANNFAKVAKPNQIPKLYRFSSDKNSPQITGTTITWTADASDPDEDQIFYRFTLNNRPVTDWQTDNTWPWATIENDVGDNQIAVCVRDNKHASLDSYDDCKSVLFMVNSPADTAIKDQVETRFEDSKYANQEIIGANPVVANSPSINNGFVRTNEYANNGVQPNCEPGSEQAVCSSQDSCVDCSGRCWPPASYDSGSTICSQGKWMLHWSKYKYI